MWPSPHLATSRLPSPATKIALPHLKTRTKYCACHKKWQYHIFVASAKFAPHARNDCDMPPTKIATLAETCHEKSLKRKSQNVTATSNSPKTPPSKRQSQSDCEENWGSHTTMHLHNILHPLTFPHVSSLFPTNLTHHASIQNPLQKLCPMWAP